MRGWDVWPPLSAWDPASCTADTITKKEGSLSSTIVQEMVVIRLGSAMLQTSAPGVYLTYSQKKRSSFLEQETWLSMQWSSIILLSGKLIDELWTFFSLEEHCSKSCTQKCMLWVWKLHISSGSLSEVTPLPLFSCAKTCFSGWIAPVVLGCTDTLL